MEAAHLCGKGHLGCINPAHLQWKTSKENKADQLAHGTRNFGVRNGSAKITPEVAQHIQAMAGRKTYRRMADEIGIDPSTVSLIARGQLWGHLLCHNH